MAYDTVFGRTVRAEAFVQSRVPPNWRWSWDGLICAVPGWEAGGGVVDLVAGRIGSWVGTTPAYSSGTASWEPKFAGAEYLSFGDTGTVFGSALYGSVTLLAIHSPSATSQTAIWTYAGATGGAQAPFSLVYSLSSNSQYAFWNDNNATGPATGATTFAAGTRNLVIGRRTGTNTASPTLDLFVNAGKWTTTSTGIDVHWNNAESGLLQCINRFGGFNGYVGSGTISNVLLWNRALSDTEIDQLLSDPWGPLRQMSSAYVFLQAPAAPPSGGHPAVKRFGGIPYMARNIRVW